MAFSMQAYFLQFDLVVSWGLSVPLATRGKDWNTCGAARLWLAVSCLGIRWSWSSAHCPHAVGVGRTKQVGWSPEGMMEKIFSQEIMCGAVDMAQRLRALAVPPEVLSSIPSKHMAAHSHL